MSSDVAVVVLAGGEGRRLGGSKPLRTLGEERLIDRALAHARKWADLVAVAVRNRAQVGAVKAELILDADVPGPLGGLISGLAFARDSGCAFVLAVPSDLPFLPVDLLDRLSAAIGDAGCALAESGGEIHPVCGLWRASDLEQAQDYAASGRRSLKGLAAQLGFVAAEWPAGPEDPFFNVNSSEDLAEAARRS